MLCTEMRVGDRSLIKTWGMHRHGFHYITEEVEGQSKSSYVQYLEFSSKFQGKLVQHEQCEQSSMSSKFYEMHGMIAIEHWGWSQKKGEVIIRLRKGRSGVRGNPEVEVHT